jgi:hypothetical protein
MSHPSSTLGSFIHHGMCRQKHVSSTTTWLGLNTSHPS